MPELRVPLTSSLEGRYIKVRYYLVMIELLRDALGLASDEKQCMQNP